MTLGSGIFWSTVLLILVVGATRVSAKKKWGLVLKAVGGLVVVGGVVVSCWRGWITYKDRPQVMVELSGVRLGMTPLEVKLAKGAPIQQTEIEAELDKQRVSQTWAFRENDYSEVVIVNFYGKNAETLKASVVCVNEGYGQLLGLGRSSSEQQVLSKLGQPTSTSIAKDGLSKMMSFAPWKVAYEIKKGQVDDFCISESGKVVFGAEYGTPEIPQPILPEPPLIPESRPVSQPKPELAKWRDLSNWRSLKKGMTPDEVQTILGTATKVATYSGSFTWEYGAYSVLGGDCSEMGQLNFNNGAGLDSWTEPSGCSKGLKPAKD